ncbi:hypothetical protein TUM3794_35770 [Shewanella colwelliana]|uniref:Uncharacterized protein n=1 Tax=Shewanella colwelliana TaxID=23 RepID=A0ABQ4PDH0_SHECO|nr:hypothetical protein [Shewanella colwelliana]GIU45449.1 hypothetical protein TUM3794_35770 [Shewanella colwelliana]
MSLRQAISNDEGMTFKYTFQKKTSPTATQTKQQMPNLHFKANPLWGKSALAFYSPLTPNEAKSKRENNLV